MEGVEVEAWHVCRHHLHVDSGHFQEWDGGDDEGEIKIKSKDSGVSLLQGG